MRSLLYVFSIIAKYQNVNTSGVLAKKVIHFANSIPHVDNTTFCGTYLIVVTFVTILPRSFLVYKVSKICRGLKAV